VACIDSSAQTNLQPPTHSGGLISDGTTFIAADDFLFTNMTKISGVTWWGQSNSLSGAGNFGIAVLSEFLGMAGPAVVFYASSPEVTLTGAEFSSGQREFQYKVWFPTSFVAQANSRYWVTIHGGGTNWRWEASAAGNHDALQRQLDNVGNPWMPTTTGLAFSLHLTSAPAQLRREAAGNLLLWGTVDGAYRIESSGTLPATNWLVLTNLVLPYSPFSYVDPTARNQNVRFYRAISLQ